MSSQADSGTSPQNQAAERPLAEVQPVLKQLVDERDLLRYVLDAIDDVVFVKDRRQRYVLISAAGARAIGRAPAEVVGLRDQDLLTPETAAECARRDAEVMRTRAPVAYEQDFLDGSGGSHTYWMKKFPWLSENGEVRGVIGIGRDVSARRDAEAHSHALAEENAERERQLRTLMENLPGMVYRCRNDADWTIEFVSAGCLVLTGYAPDELVGSRVCSYGSLIHAEDRELVWDAVQAGLRAQRRFQVEYRLIDRAGVEHYVWEQGCGVLGRDGELQALEGFVVDWSARRKAELDRERLAAQLRQRHKMEAIGALAGGVAHDFNNILTAILGNCDLIEHDPEWPPRLRHAVSEIMDAANRAAALTRQLLAFGRQDVVHPKPVDLVKLYQRSKQMLVRLLGENVCLTETIAPDTQWVIVDPGQMEQVVLNLVVNARDALPDGGEVHVTITNAPPRHGDDVEQVLLEVRDSGVGIPAEVLPHIYEPFFTTKARGRGTGLGLATVHGIVTSAGGQIEASSRPGVGTTFRVRLPATAPEPIEDEEPTPAASARSIPATVLLCEDEAQTRTAMAGTLEAAGYEVLTATTAEEALQIATDYAGPLDLLLTDLSLPGMNGRQLAETLLTALPSLCVLCVSGYPADEPLQLSTGTSLELLPKPFGRERLLQAVQAALARNARNRSG